MGFARILGGGPTGRYSIELDWGSATRTAVLGALGVRVADLDADLAVVQAKVIEADAKEAAARAEVTAQVTAYVASSAALPPGSPRPDSKGFEAAMQSLLKLQRSHAMLRMAFDKLTFERATALERVAFWTNFAPIETRDAWCASLKEDKAAGSTVATLDINGESDLIVIAPEARGWAPSDGVLTAREMMSPEQAFWNAAVLPGWQKFKPTYRWGTVTSISFALDQMNVDLGEANSSAKRLDINQATSLSAVPVTYGTCHSKAFKIGDRVVVQFQGQDWTSPRVIGFLDNPRGCDWGCVGTYGPFPLFATTIQASIDYLFDNWASLSIYFKSSIFGGGWINLRDASTAPAPIQAYWPDLDDVDATHIHVRRTYMAPSWGGSLPADEYDTRAMFFYIFRPAYLPGALPTDHLGGIFFNWQTVANTQMVDDIVEVRIMQGASVVFNAATRKPLVGGDIDREVRSRSGRQNLIGSYNILDIAGYTLYSETP